jgi:hypothetical protein
MDEKTEAFLKRMPELRKRDVEDINSLFDSYIFRRKSTGEVWTTCCRKHATLPATHKLWWEEHVREPHSAWDNDPILRQRTPCPFCGKEGKVKDLRYTGRRENLEQTRRFVLLRWDGKALWACAGEARKLYYWIDRLTDAPEMAERAVYRFDRVAAESAFCGYWGDWHKPQRDAYADFNNKTVAEPFTFSFDQGMGYSVIGADAIEKSPVRYCRAEDWIAHRDEVIKFLHLAHVYPRKVEMLMKAGMAEVVWDMAKRGVKHAAVMDWKAEDTRRAFKVPPEALRDFLRVMPEDRRDIGVLEFWRKLHRDGERTGMEEAAEVYDFLKGHVRAAKHAQRWKLSPLRLYRYLDSQWHCNIGAAAMAWADYVDMAEKQGKPLYRSDVIMPADLKERHDAMVEERNRRLAEERERREAERRRWEAERQAREAEERRARGKGYETLRKKLERKYSYSADGYQIIVPASEEEIIEEGRILQHCVAGYAQRHVEGKTTILFMRKARTPGRPWLTIEILNGELQQIHGFKNEGIHSRDGRFAPDPREKYRDFLDPWIEWWKHGSRRKKDGTPIVPNNKKESAA